MAKISGTCVGKSLVGDGNEVAHIDLLIGPRGGAVEQAFCNALTNNKDGFTTLLAVVTPNLLCKPPTILYNKVTIKDARQAVQMFGPAQYAVAKAVANSVAEGVIPANEADDLFIMRRRVHPLGSQGRQEDPGLQLSRRQGIHRPRRQRRAEGLRGHREEGLRPPPVRGRLKGRTPRSGATRQNRWSGPDSAVAPKAGFLTDGRVSAPVTIAALARGRRSHFA